jgi:hypothetical protein
MAVQSLLLAGEVFPWRAAYWFVRDSGYSDRRALKLSELEGDLITSTPDWTDLREAIKDRVGQIVEGIRAGAFPMHSADEHCTSRCEFKTVCRVNQVRSLGKTWPPQEAAP